MAAEQSPKEPQDKLDKIIEGLSPEECHELFIKLQEKYTKEPDVEDEVHGFNMIP